MKWFAIVACCALLAGMCALKVFGVVYILATGSDRATATFVIKQLVYAITFGAIAVWLFNAWLHRPHKAPSGEDHRPPE